STVNGFSLAGEQSKAKNRLTKFKDELLIAFYLDKVFKKKESGKAVEEEQQEIGAIDLSSLDVFEVNNESEAKQYALEENQPLELLDELEDEQLDESEDDFEQLDDEQDEFEEDEDFAFSMIEEEPDLTNI
ncbi:MAG: hypothetical protein JKY42_08365, partial [Flavobacteriales bacterium]|nr:hypothetical protein [Flavobacteriales bacterium]